LRGDEILATVRPDLVRKSFAGRTYVPKYIDDLPHYVPGKTISATVREFNLVENQIIKLASNENPLGMPSSAKAAILKAVNDDLSRYPDPDATLLKTALAAQFDVSPDWFAIGNGSSDILDLAARTFVGHGQSIIFSEYAFALYALATQSIGARGIRVSAKDFGHDLDAMLDNIEPDTKLIFIANPNNPTGTFLSGQLLYGFLQRVPEHIVVILDEAYTEYLVEADRYDSIPWTREFPNLMVVRTFSKAYGLAGLRIGFSVGQPPLTSLLNRVRLPFNTSSVAQAAATATIKEKETEFLLKLLAFNETGKTQLYQGFQSIGLTCLPSWANFILVCVGDAARVNRALLQRGIIVRPVNNYGLPDWLRVSIGTSEQNARFLEALSEIFTTPDLL
jgi:histidinol-phosphate aminotransferase